MRIVSSFTRPLGRILAAVAIMANCPQAAYAADPVGFLYAVTDFAIYGCAYDPDAPSTPVQIHVYDGALAMIGVANRPCLWNGSPQYAGHGFVVQYRRVVNSTSTINAAMINAPGTPGVSIWMNTPGALHVNHFSRATQTVLVESPNYSVGISKKYGAAVVEYYNKRSDPNLNLVSADIGAAFQAALFPDPASPFGQIPMDGQTVNCVKGSDFRWNPTQAGSHCPNPTPSFTPNQVLGCSSSLVGGCTAATISLGAGQSGWTQFFVRFRNFYYPDQGVISYPYRHYDEVFGYVTYTFTEHYVQLDYQLWRDAAGAGGTNPPPSRGVGRNQLPVFFGAHFSEMLFKENSVVQNVVATGTTDVFRHVLLTNDDGRWITMLANPSTGYAGADILMTNYDVVTAAFYSKAHAGACPGFRFFAMDFPKETGPEATIQRTGTMQNVIDFELQFPHYIEFRSMLFPYKYDEVMPGYVSQLSTLIDSYSGFMPAWECNM